MFLTIPNNRVCFIDYLFEQIPNWKNQTAFLISSGVYDIIKKEKFFDQETNLWIRKEGSSKVTGNNSPSQLSFELKKVRFDLWTIEWIEYDGSRQYFTSNPIGSAYITAA